MWLPSLDLRGLIPNNWLNRLKVKRGGKGKRRTKMWFLSCQEAKSNIRCKAELSFHATLSTQCQFEGIGNLLGSLCDQGYFGWWFCRGCFVGLSAAKQTCQAIGCESRKRSTEASQEVDSAPQKVTFWVRHSCCVPPVCLCFCLLGHSSDGFTVLFLKLLNSVFCPRTPHTCHFKCSASSNQALRISLNLAIFFPLLDYKSRRSVVGFCFSSTQ